MKKMSLRNCTITFDNRSNFVFYSGESVSGSIYLTMERNKSCEALMLKISGLAKVRWRKNYGGGRTKTYTALENYFEIRDNLLSQETIQGTGTRGTSELSAGNHSYKFSFTIPPNLPASLEGVWGFIRYRIKITLKRSFKFDISHKQYFTVLSLVDLNRTPNVKLPVVNECRKTFNFLFFNKGEVRLETHIPQSGYVPGQNMHVRCILKNNSELSVEVVKLLLIKTITFTATRPHRRVRKTDEKIKCCILEGVDSKDEKSQETLIVIPSIPPNSFTSCSIIEVNYTLQVCAVVSGLYRNLIAEIPITIGTYPLLTITNSTEQPTTSSHDINSPSINYSEMPPPSYEEAMSVQRMTNDDEDASVTDSYTPKYPVYNFDALKKELNS